MFVHLIIQNLILPDEQHLKIVKTWGQNRWLANWRSDCFCDWICVRNRSTLSPLKLWSPQLCGNADRGKAGPRKKLEPWYPSRLLNKSQRTNLANPTNQPPRRPVALCPATAVATQNFQSTWKYISLFMNKLYCNLRWEAH